MSGLNFDILHAICAFITDVAAISSFSRTCSTLRPVAVERLQRLHPITIRNAKSLHDIHNFIFADAEARGPRVHTINIQMHPSEKLVDSSEDLTHCMLAVLSSASHVHSLSICVPTQLETPFSDHRIIAAIAEIGTLQELSIASSKDQANEILRTTCSSLKTFRHRDMYTTLKPQPPYFTKLAVAPYSLSTLEEVELPSYFCLSMLSSGIILPAVRAATFTDIYEPNMLRIFQALVVFPNLDRSLIMHDRLHVYGAPLSTDELPLAAALRTDNRNVQRTRSWTGLARLAGSPLMLHILSLTCPIHHITLNLAPELEVPRPHALDVSCVRSVLAEHAPTHLALVNLRLRLPLGLSILDDALFPEAAVARLSHLVLHAECINAHPHPQSQPGDALDNGRSSWDTVLVSG